MVPKQPNAVARRRGDCRCKQRSRCNMWRGHSEVPGTASWDRHEWIFGNICYMQSCMQAHRKYLPNMQYIYIYILPIFAYYIIYIILYIYNLYLHIWQICILYLQYIYYLYIYTWNEKPMSMLYLNFSMQYIIQRWGAAGLASHWSIRQFMTEARKHRHGEKPWHGEKVKNDRTTYIICGGALQV